MTMWAIDKINSNVSIEVLKENVVLATRDLLAVYVCVCVCVCKYYLTKQWFCY